MTRSVKPSNGVEEKTEQSISIMFDGALTSQKLIDVEKGGSIL
ncbi:TPA: hypothetical protein ACGUVV_003473 [Vibrio vulnificus]|nr:hypothetical protein [Vibrio vulnificus]MDS1804030.1 hypothetical protein [Vibrio vulnificus]